MPAVKRKRTANQREGWRTRLMAFGGRYSAAAIAGAFVLLLLAGVFLWAGGYFGAALRAADRTAANAAVAAGFEVRRVLLRGAHQTAHAEVVAALGPTLGRSILHLRLDDARRRIENIGWVRSAAVTRLLPNTISISIREREPAAVWQIDGNLHLIDASGAVIRAVSAYEYSNLPLIVGAGAPEAASGILKALAAEEELQRRTYALVRVGERRWNMRLRNNIDIKLPEQNFVGAIGDLALLQAAQGTLDQPLEYIDLRDPERMIIKRRGEPIAPGGVAPGE